MQEPTGLMGPLEHDARKLKLRSDRLARGALWMIATLFCTLTWRKWGTPIIDCGHEMYVPAALNAGKRLYFEVWYAYGPLIPYWHALLFRLFGVHLWILQTAGIAIVFVMTNVIYALSRIFLPVALSFVAAFAFLVQAFQLGLFNFILPYSYPAGYGAMLFVILVYLLVKDCFQEKWWTLFAAGSIAGLEAITKIEFGAAAFALVCAAIFIRVERSRSLSRLTKDIANCIPGFLLCAGIYGWYIEASSVHFIFAQNMPLLPDSYFVKLVGEVRNRSVGTTMSAALMLKWTILGLIGISLVAGAVWLASISRLARWLLAAITLLVCVVHLAATYAEKVLHWSIPPLLFDVAPFFFFNRGMVLIAAAFSIPVLLRRRKCYLPRDSALLLLMAGAFAAGFRILVGVEPAGFAIFYDTVAVIAFLAVLWELARFFGAPTGGSHWSWTSALLCCGLLSLTAVHYPIHLRPFQISSSKGSMYTDPWTGKAYAEALAFLKDAASHSEPFVVWPEEASFYYFAGTVAPSTWYQVTPGILPPGELTSRYLDDMERQHVRYVALSNRGAPEYGLPIFGIDYNQPLYRWLQQNFRIIRTFGDYERVAYPRRWAVQIWERKSPDKTVSP